MNLRNDLIRSKYDYLTHVSVELLVCITFVAGISGYLAHSLPTYAKKARLSDVLIAITSYKSDITAEFAERGVWPAKHRIDTQFENQYGVIQQVLFDGQGTINFYLNNDYPELAGKVVSFTAAYVPESEMSSILWLCGYTATPQGFQKIGNNITTVNPTYLPNSCKN